MDAYNKALDDAEEAQQAADEARAKADKAQDDVAKVLEEKLDELYSDPNSDREDIARLEAMLEDMNEAKAEAQAAADEAQKATDEAQKAADALKPAADEAQEKLDRLEEISDQLSDPDSDLSEEDRQKLEDEKADLEQQKDDLDKAIEDYQNAQTEADAKQETADDLQDIADALNEHLDMTNDIAAAEQIEADEYQKLADKAQKAADEAKAEADALKPDADDAQEKLDRLEEINDQLSDPNSDLTEDEKQKLEDEKADLEAEKEALEQAIEDYRDAQAEADKAAQEAAQAQDKADEEQQEAEQAKQEHVPIYAGDDLTITARDDVGSDEDPMEITAGGETNITSTEGNVDTGHSGHVNLGDITGENVDITTTGDIKPTDSDSGIHTGVQDDPDTGEDESETETEAEVNALGSSAGTDDQPLNVDADRISGTSGDDVNIHVPDDVIVDQLTAGGDLTLDVDGDIIAGDQDEGAANVTGESLDITADGDIGSEDNYLVGDLQPEPKNPGHDEGLSADAEDIYLKLLGDVTIRDVDGNDVHIDSDGRVDGAADNGNAPDVDAENLWINGNNGVGTEDNPLIIHVPGIVEILSKYGEVWYRNLFRYLEETYGCCCQCSFWDMVVARILAAEEGETVEILQIVPCHRMPEKVMAALRERSDVTLVLNLRDGTQLIIGAGTALPAPAEPGHHCYDIYALVEHYMGTKL